jgi:RNA-directed DNA polymerase
MSVGRDGVALTRNAALLALFGPGRVAATYGEIAHRGGRGLDRLGRDTFRRQSTLQCSIITRKCMAGTYRFTPYLEQLRVKGRGKSPRLISAPTIRDKIVLVLLKEYLQGQFPDAVARKLPNEHIRELRSFLQKNEVEGLFCLRTDLKSFFDNIPHEPLLAILRESPNYEGMVDRLVRASLVTPTVPADYRRCNRRHFRPTCGVPQGLPTSNVLADIYLHQFDITARRLGLHYVRYVDDILLFMRAEDCDRVSATMRSELMRLGLQANEDKTILAPVQDGFDFLGYNIKPPQLTVRQATCERFIRSIASLFSSYQHRSDSSGNPTWMSSDLRRTIFVDSVNEKLTGVLSGNRQYGWLFYFIEITDVELLHRIDHIVTQMFDRLDDFDRKAPTSLKRIARAYYEARHNRNGNYIPNFNRLSTTMDRLGFLQRIGDISPDQAAVMTQDEVEVRFEHARRRRLAKLDRDVGTFS